MPLVELLPLGHREQVATGASLETILFPRGVEFPCGGAGTCGGCRVRVLRGELPITAAMRDVLSDSELAAGWRLACEARVLGDIALEVEQWSTPVLADESQFAFEPAPGHVLAIDLGTTTIAAQLVDGMTAQVLAVETSLNPQAAYGADVMTRVEFAKSGGARLTELIRAHLAALPRAGSREILICGNSVMEHLFCGADVEPLSRVPFEPALRGVHATPHGTFLPSLGGFVGSDILAGVVATGLHESNELTALIDLGTNGELVVGNRERMLCASTAAGPAFEAGRIRCGMRAAEGAIAHVDAGMHCTVIGGGAARGICGSGLVDAVAAGLDTGLILPNGRLANGAKELPLAGPVALSQADIRELQLAKGAIAAGLRILTARLGATPADVRTVWLAGAFGNYIRTASARRIGLLEAAEDRIRPAGNAALRGTKIIGLNPSRRRFYTEELPARIEHVPLAADPAFQDTFVECLALA